MLELGRDAQRNPDTSVSERVRLELQSRLADTGRNFFVREDLNKLPETMALWKEVLRLHPVAIAVLRETGEPLQRNAQIYCTLGQSLSFAAAPLLYLFLPSTFSQVVTCLYWRLQERIWILPNFRTGALAQTTSLKPQKYSHHT